MSREIIQISAAAIPENPDTYGHTYLYAMCDDGTVWAIDTVVNDGDPVEPKWMQIPPVPQDEK